MEVNVRGVDGSGKESINFLDLKIIWKRWHSAHLFLRVGHVKINTLLGVAYAIKRRLRQAPQSTMAEFCFFGAKNATGASISFEHGFPISSNDLTVSGRISALKMPKRWWILSSKYFVNRRVALLSFVFGWQLCRCY